MGSSNDNWVEDMFWLILKTSWLIIVVCVSAALFIYRLLAKQSANRPSTVKVSAAVTPEKAKTVTPPTSNRTLAVLTITIAIGVTLIVASIASSSTSLFILSLVAFGTGAMFVLFANAPTFTDIAVTADTPPTDTPLALPEPVTELQSYTIRMARETEWNREQALHFIEQMVATFPHLILRLVADHQSISWQLVDTANFSQGVVEPMLRACYPTAEITTNLLAAEVVDEPFFRVVCSFKQVNDFVAPLMYVTDIKQGSNHFDPLSAFAQAMNSLHPGERIILSFGILGFAEGAHKRGEKMITQSTIHPLQWASWAGIQDALVKKAYNVDRVDKYVSEDQRVLNEKLRQKLYHCVLLLQIDAAEAQRTAELLAQTMTEFTHFSWIPYNALDWYETDIEACVTYVQDEQQAYAAHSLTQIQRIIEAQINGRSYHALPQDRQYPLLILEPREMATLWHVPHKEFTASRIGWSRGLVNLSEVTYQVRNGINLGHGIFDNKHVPVLLPDEDRVTHLNIIGRTGMGKSTLMHHLIHQDIAAGRGVAVIDPHGKLVSDILRTSIPETRASDVVVLDLANDDYPPPLNPLVGIDDYTSTLRMVSIIDRMFQGTEESARMASYLRASLIPLQGDAQATMRDVTRLFMDEVFRQQRIVAVDDPETQDFWDFHYNPSSPALQRQISEPIILRVRPFYANPTLYPILCHPDRLNFRQLIEQNKIILISLAIDEERVPEQERNLVGALLMSRLQLSGMKERAQRRDPFFIYVDEVQKFVTTSLSDMFSEARKFGLSLVTANQFLGQLTDKMLESVMGNVGTTVVFRCSPDDGQTLAAYMRPEYKAHQLVNLDRYEAVVKMQVYGETQPAFSLLTLEPPPEDKESAAREAHLRQLSRELYTPKPRREVLDWLSRRYRRGGGNEADLPQSDPGGDPSQFFDVPSENNLETLG